MSRTNAAFMSGVPKLLILRLLDNTEMYGYELVRNIKITTSNSICLAEGVVYPTLHSLEAKGMLQAREDNSAGRLRVYYRTSAKGKKRLKDLTKEWNSVRNGINSVLRGV